MKSHFFLLLAPILAATAGVACAPEKTPPPAKGPAAVASLVPVAPRAERRLLARKGGLAMSRRDYAACADLFGAAGEAFTAASCQAMAGNGSPTSSAPSGTCLRWPSRRRTPIK